MEEKQLFTNLHKSKSCRQTDNRASKMNTANNSLQLHKYSECSPSQLPFCRNHLCYVEFQHQSGWSQMPRYEGHMDGVRSTLTLSADLLPSTGHRLHATHFWIQPNNRHISWEVSLGAAAGPSQGGGQVTLCRIGPFGGGNHKAHLISARASSAQLCHVKYQHD